MPGTVFDEGMQMYRQLNAAEARSEVDRLQAENERLREALAHAGRVLYTIGTERRTDDAHKINAHVEHVRISRVLSGLPPVPTD